MRKVIRKVIAAATAVTIFFGCTNSDSTMGSTQADSGTSTAAVGSENRSDSNNGVASDRDARTDSTEERYISADNKIGRRMHLVALMQQNRNLSTFVELIRSADLVVEMESPANYTVFAPTNEAFAALPAGTLEALKAPGNKTELANIIQAHVVPEKFTSAELRHNLHLDTSFGKEVIVKRNGATITVGDAQIIMSDVEASNGIVHVINKVLVPPK